MWFKAYHVFGHGKSMDVSNYQANTDLKTCKGCGLCVKRCPMEAIRLEASDDANNKTGRVAVLEKDRCIGCGVCAYKCPAKSIVLIKRDEITEPPANTREYNKRFFNDFANPLPKRKI
ncbi:MAG: 4Fe-4S binding protein [Proteobacteria bacterium]|nr:4Fe-4S binding protein [Pseudomonadota bacterium]MBU4470805.1 4Fe-4S binding protein [Pseudomonadota bacterium]MCG2751467.1 4Fe-4S binding protein [Desulfobacteraceae bacterium]